MLLQVVFTCSPLQTVSAPQEAFKHKRKVSPLKNSDLPTNAPEIIEPWGKIRYRITERKLVMEVFSCKKFYIGAMF